jgi:hypothetical protein
MKRSQLLVTALVFAFPVTVSAQHGVVRGGHAAGGQNQQQSMMRQQQQAMKQQQQMEKAQQRAFQQQAKQQQKALAAQQKNAMKGQQSAAQPQANAAKHSVHQANKTGHAQSNASTTHSSAAKKSATTGKKELTARERREHEHLMEEERIARVKRWDAFERWLRESNLLREYEARFRATNSYVAMEDWLVRQESLRKRGLAVDPLFMHYRSFMAKSKK